MYYRDNIYSLFPLVNIANVRIGQEITAHLYFLFPIINANVNMRIVGNEGINGVQIIVVLKVFY